MSDTEKKVVSEIVTAYNEMNPAERMQANAYMKGLVDGKRIAQQEAAQSGKQ